MQPRRRLYVRRIVSKKTVVMELERRVRMSLQEDGMTGLIVMDITAALEGDEDTCVRYCSFREREDFGLDTIGDDCARETMRACSGIFPCRRAS